MRRTRSFSIWLAVSAAPPLLGACSHEVLLRTDYDLGHVEAVVASSSVLEPRHLPKHLAPGRVLITYPFLVQNTSPSASRILALTQGSVELGKTSDGAPISIPAVCRARGEDSARDLVLAPGQKARLECSAEIVTDDRNRLKERDTQAHFILPVEKSAGTRAGIFRFRYLLKIEDFE